MTGDPSDDAWRDRRIGPYRLVERLGVGGMGEVYRAARADAQFEQQVAIKLVRAGLHSQLVFERFRAERQILADLEHPGIARLLDGGVTAEGLPYLVMELVEGEPIDHYCESHQLPIPQRLRLFRQACAAVSYAHRHLVVHRDLKPTNILVSASGAVKLLDFGIAKLVQEGSSAAPAGEPTVAGLLAVTPAYASPEQLQGLPVTTTSDVYSLGVILYQLLSGRSPYRGDFVSAAAALHEVCELDPQAPSVAAAATQPARAPPGAELDAITLKALRKEPGSRYSSVEQLIADIDCYLGGRPVSAHGGQLAYRAAKFLRRHRLEVAGAALVVLALVAGIVAATHAAQRAREQQRAAERNFARVRQLADTVMFQLHDSIREIPGSTAARQLLVQQALHYLAALARDSAGDVALQRDLAAAYERIGDVQGQAFGASLGDTAGALRSYQAALALREAIQARSSGGSVPDTLALARTRRLHSEALAMSGNIQGSAAEINQAVAAMQPLARDQPRDAAVLEELYLDYADLAGVLGGNFNFANLGDQRSAFAAHQHQLQAASQLVALEPGNAHFQGLQIVAKTNYADQLMLTGRVREAAAYYASLREPLESQVATAPSTKNMQWLHSLYTRLETVALWDHDPGSALQSGRAALAIARRLESSDPQNAYAVLDLATDYANQADELSQTGDQAGAARAADDAVRILEPLAASNPSNGEFRVTYGLVLYVRGEVAARAHDPEAALRSFRPALAVFEKIRAADAENADARLHVAATLVRTADELALAGDPGTARGDYLRAVELTGGGAEPASDEAHYALAAAADGLERLELQASRASAGAAVRAEHAAAACDWFHRAQQARGQIHEVGALSPNGFYLGVDAAGRRRPPTCPAVHS